MQVNWHNISRHLYKQKVYENGPSLPITILPNLKHHSHLVHIINSSQVGEQPRLSQNHIFVSQIQTCHKEIMGKFHSTYPYGDIPTNTLKAHGVARNAFKCPGVPRV